MKFALVLLCLVVGTWAGCQEERTETLNKKLIGAVVPKCDNSGNYLPMQCSGSTGYCWCVDTTTGKQIDGTAARGTVTCTQTPCQQARAEKTTQIGGWTPVCDSEGDYEPIQCSASTGYCWCADILTGSKVANSAVRGKPTCASKCEQQRSTSLKNIGIGAFIVSCDNSTGGYSTTQCHSSTGYCWCADAQTGQKIVGTEKRGTPQCGTTCNIARTKALNEKKIGTFVPVCTKDGEFKQVQCSSSTGFCWCTDTKTGEKLVGSEVRGTPDCQTKCQKQRSEVISGNLIGSTVPTCDNITGEYTPMQCNPSTGFCWCADVVTGDKIVGTEARGDVDCSVCNIARAKAQANKKIGTFVPTCSADGSFKTVQCSGSTGFCWCADPKTGEKLVGSEVRGTPSC